MLRIAIGFALAASFAHAQSPCDATALYAGDAQPLAELHLLDAQGDLALAGSFQHKQADGTTTGAAYLYRRQAAGVWVQEVELLPPVALGVTYFGFSGAIDGDRVAIGAPLDHDVAPQQGAVWIYERGASGWAFEAKLHAPDAATDDQFGTSVSMSGPYLFATSIFDDDVGMNTGSVNVFRRDAAGNWAHVDKLVGAGLAPNDLFGRALRVSGALALIGAPDSDLSGFSSGAVYVYRLESGTWTAKGTLLSGPFAFATHFGAAIAIDGNRVLVGAAAYSSSNPQGGFARLYEIDASGAWAQVAQLTAPQPDKDAKFGSSVALRGDWIVCGAPFQTTTTLNEGAAHVYHQTGGVWTHIAELNTPTGQFYDQYGTTVALTDDAILVGESGNDVSGLNAGAVHVHEFTHGEVLNGCPKHLSVAAGGTQSLQLSAGVAHAGELYLVLGSLSGASPGIAVDGLVLPLNVDPYFMFTLGTPNTPLLTSSFGITSATGSARSTLNLPAGALPALIGTMAHHSAVVLPLSTAGSIQVISNPAVLAFVP